MAKYNDFSPTTSLQLSAINALSSSPREVLKKYIEYPSVDLCFKTMSTSGSFASEHFMTLIPQLSDCLCAKMPFLGFYDLTA